MENKDKDYLHDINDCSTWNEFAKALLVFLFLAGVVLVGTAMIIYALFG